MLYQIPPLQYQGLTHKSHIYIFSADTFLECILTWSILVMVLLREVYIGGGRRQEDYLFPQPVTSEEEAISCNWPTPPFHTLYYVPSSFICIYMVQQSLIVHGHFVFDSTLFLLNFFRTLPLYDAILSYLTLTYQRLLNKPRHLPL